MNLLQPLGELDPGQPAVTGGKACRLADLARQGFPIAPGLCITTEAFERFLKTTGLETKIRLELGRLPLDTLRWEEIWDLSQRIRNLFLTTPMQDELYRPLARALTQQFGRRPVVVRSSSPQEDSAARSFAGLHDSYVNLCGVDPVLEHVRLVWASLWSDGALLYRKELGRDIATGSMAVVIQELIDSTCAGVAFSQNPANANETVIEAVHGLNQGLVDGSVEPDRWILDRQTGELKTHAPAQRNAVCRPVDGGLRLEPLSEAQALRPPLSPPQLQQVYDCSRQLETAFRDPQDLEWTFCRDTFYLLQTRPITTLQDQPPEGLTWEAADKRPWYLSLKRSLENLQDLHGRIEHRILPDMQKETDRLARIDLERIPDDRLPEELRNRMDIHKHWVEVYWCDLIPFAHGARLFGQVYNDTVKPDDPFEYLGLLRGPGLKSIARNRELAALVDRIRQDSSLRRRLEADPDSPSDRSFARQLETFIRNHHTSTFKSVRLFEDPVKVVKLLLTWAAQPEQAPEEETPEVGFDGFIGRFPPEKQDFAREILEIGRASYRLRDDDNLILAGIESEVLRAVAEGARRLRGKGHCVPADPAPEALIHALENPEKRAFIPPQEKLVDEPVEQQTNPHLNPPDIETRQGAAELRARQLIGQPAGRGLAIGCARVIASPDDLFAFQPGEILVCDAIDPNMTFIVPMAAAIIERRGGMLVHGAIIAREYGIPCITGVEHAGRLIRTGRSLTVDGFLGIVTLH